MLAILAQSDTEVSVGGGIFGGAFLLIWLAFLVLYLVSAWKIWQKMGDPGWMGIVPLLNYYRVFQRTRPDQAVIFTVLSFFCCIFGLIGVADLAKLFGKDALYTLGLIFLPFIFLPMLAFGDAQYQGPPPPQFG
jgi:Family of unknown function (DUF5684)